MSTTIKAYACITTSKFVPWIVPFHSITYTRIHNKIVVFCVGGNDCLMEKARFQSMMNNQLTSSTDVKVNVAACRWYCPQDNFLNTNLNLDF